MYSKVKHSKIKCYTKKWLFVQFFHSKTVSSVFTQPLMHFMWGWNMLLILFILQTTKNLQHNCWFPYIVYCTHCTVHRVLYSVCTIYNYTVLCIKQNFFDEKLPELGTSKFFRVTASQGDLKCCQTCTALTVPSVG